MPRANKLRPNPKWKNARDVRQVFWILSPDAVAQLTNGRIAKRVFGSGSTSKKPLVVYQRGPSGKKSGSKRGTTR